MANIMEKRGSEDRNQRIMELSGRFNRTVMTIDTKPGETVYFEFDYNPGPEIYCFTTSCGCTDVNYNKDQNRIQGQIDVGNPDVSKGPTTLTRNVTVYFYDDEPWFIIDDYKRKNNPEKLGITLNIILNVS